MTKTYIELSFADVSVQESQLGFSGDSRWEAMFYGDLPNGVSVSVTRTGPTYQDAVDNLRVALETQGWSLPVG